MVDDEKNVAETSEIFMVKARRCKRCGGLLTSREAVADGYGHICKMKARIEKFGEPQLDGQVSLFDDLLKEEQ